MNIGPALEDWNYQELMLIQALVGAISSNFRMVALCFDGDSWVIKFYLELEIEEDIEEIEGVVCQYTAYQTSSLKCKVETIFGLGKLPGFSDVGRILYRRRESINS